MTTYDKLIIEINQLSRAEKVRLAEHLLQVVTHADDAQPDDPPLTVEEIRAWLNGPAKTGAEIAQSDAVGAWEGLGIEDGAAWVNEQKHKRTERKQW